MKKNSIQFILGTKGLIPSVNSMYKAKLIYKYGKPVPTIYKDGLAVKVIEQLNEQLRQIDFNSKAPWIFKKDAVFNLHIQLIFKQSFYKRDTDNTIKLLQDTIFRYLGLNDSRVISVFATKTICPSISEEKICVSLSESFEDIRFDHISELPCPGRIFLGGTCNGTDWRDKIISRLDKMGIDYFNPIVPDWTPECQEIENLEKSEKCDCHLYILSPEMTGVFSVAELINSSWEIKSEGTGNVLVGVLGDSGSWGQSRWKSINSTLDLVNKISGGSKNIVGVLLGDNPEGILDYIKQPEKKKRKVSKSE